MKASERLLKYVTVYTTSDEDSESCPSSARQFDLAKMLVDELKTLGAENAECDDKCYVYAFLPATEGYESAPAIGFIAHMDTAPDFCGENVKPQIIENYDGLDIVLKDGKIISKRKFHHLEKLKGRTLITTDGTTLLGADDKAGVAEIMTALERIVSEKIPHGKLCFSFTPDEEIGRGSDHFDIERFGADFAYTVDGGPEGEISYENFNAAGGQIKIRGVNVHPGEAKNVMVNAALVANELISLLPWDERPENTEGREGFYHITQVNANVESAIIKFIIRDHDKDTFEYRKSVLTELCARLDDKYGAGSVVLEMKDQYYNMIEKIEPCMHLVDIAVEATQKAGVTPAIEPVRGGTDGAQLSFKGLPCPNLGTGGYCYHGPMEHISVEGMDKCVEIILNIIRAYGDFGDFKG